MMSCRALDSRCLLVLRNPHDAPYSFALWAFRVVTYYDYFLFSPFFLLSVNNFFPDFFLCVQVRRTDDLHLLQFFTKPALKVHIYIFLLVELFFLKSSIIR
jgi:hypothetical protein